MEGLLSLVIRLVARQTICVMMVTSCRVKAIVLVEVMDNGQEKLQFVIVSHTQEV